MWGKPRRTNWAGAALNSSLYTIRTLHLNTTDNKRACTNYSAQSIATKNKDVHEVIGIIGKVVE